jgi:hypothetical protein
MANGGTQCGQSGAPPCEDDPRTPKIVLRSQGLLALAFGLALGVTFMLFCGLFSMAGAPDAPDGALASFIADLRLNLWLSFLYGFIGGLGIAVVYNLLVVRRLNLFGLEGSMD